MITKFSLKSHVTLLGAKSFFLELSCAVAWIEGGLVIVIAMPRKGIMSIRYEDETRRESRGCCTRQRTYHFLSYDCDSSSAKRRVYEALELKLKD